MQYRSKEATRALDELDRLTDTWGVSSVAVVDNILDMTYFDSLLPSLGVRQKKPKLFFEVKSNLKRHHLKALADAGVRCIQPGIESLSDRVLKLMRKGTTGLRNVQMLKWCSEFGIKPEWNILYGFPGETRQDYATFLAILSAISHLEPPSGCGPVRLDRFSPYFVNPENFGLKNLRPIAPFEFLYPFDAVSLEFIAYYFDFDYEASVATSQSRPRLSHDKDNVELIRAKPRQIFAWRSFDDADVNPGMLRRIASQQLRQESRRQRGNEADL